MGTGTVTKQQAWRDALAKRRAKAERGQRRRKPLPVRPGGNAPTRMAAFAGERTETPAPREIPKHVPRNTHRAGSIAYAFLYAYRNTQ